jgi:gliding motility-associated lipoprotein GldD
MKNYLMFLGLSCLFVVVACEETVYSPKPRGYPKVVYPAKVYQQFDENYCHFTFEYPQYAKIVQDTQFFGEKPSNDCWFDLAIPQYNASLHCCYYPITKEKGLEKLNLDAFELAGKHTIKADYIDNIKVQQSGNVNGFIFDIQGAVASPYQFYLTDSSKHYFRGSLYFKTHTNADSLAPVLDFVKKDITHLIETFKWNK